MDAFDLECNCIYEVTYACTQADPVKWKSMLARVGVSALYFKTAMSVYTDTCAMCVWFRIGGCVPCLACWE